MSLPRYRDLPPGEILPRAWNLWRDGNQIGMWNNMTPHAVIDAARLIQSGRRFNLNLPLHVPVGLLPEGAHAVRRGLSLPFRSFGRTGGAIRRIGESR